MSKKNKILSFIKDIIIYILIAFLITTVIRIFLLEAYNIDGTSMEPTLQNNNEVIVWKITNGPIIPVANIKINSLTKHKRGDIIIFHSINYKPSSWFNELIDFLTLGRINFEWKDDMDKIIIKRVIGEPGDRIQLVDNSSNQIYINGKMLRREFISHINNSYSYRKTSIFKEYTGNEYYTIQYSGTLPIINNDNHNTDNEIYIPKKGDILTLEKNGTNTILNIKINGEKMTDEWRYRKSLERINEETAKDLLNFEEDFVEYTIKNNYYFVLGDNRDRSLDSADWGILREELIIGTPLIRVLPLKKFGKIN